MKQKSGKTNTKDKNANKMREVKIDKLVLSVGGTADSLEKGFKLLKALTGKTPAKMQSSKRIPTFGVRPKLEVGAVVTLRKDIDGLLKKMLSPSDNTLRKKQVSENTVSFGIKEYIEVPGVEYQRDIGIRGLDVTITFKRAGRRVKLKKIKRGKLPKKQHVSKEEIVKFMEENFNTKFI